MREWGRVSFAHPLLGERLELGRLEAGNHVQGPVFKWHWTFPVGRGVSHCEPGEGRCRPRICRTSPGGLQQTPGDSVSHLGKWWHH